jgi:hypothetical protein
VQGSAAGAAEVQFEVAQLELPSNTWESDWSLRTLDDRADQYLLSTNMYPHWRKGKSVSQHGPNSILSAGAKARQEVATGVVLGKQT